MAAIDTLLNSISGKTFTALSGASQAVMSEAFKARGIVFEPDQYALMRNWFLVVPASRVAELDLLNAGRLAQARPVALADGTLILPICLLTDCATANANYGHLRNFLFSLKFKKVLASDWPIATTES